MNSPNDALVHSLTRSQMLLQRYTADLSLLRPMASIEGGESQVLPQ